MQKIYSQKLKRRKVGENTPVASGAPLKRRLPSKPREDLPKYIPNYFNLRRLAESPEQRRLPTVQERAAKTEVKRRFGMSPEQRPQISRKFLDSIKKQAERRQRSYPKANCQQGSPQKIKIFFQDQRRRNESKPSQGSHRQSR